MTTLKILIMSLAFALSSIGIAADTGDIQDEANQDNTVHVARGKAISMDELTAIADLSSARDEKGNTVSLNEEGGYTIGSFTRGTITIVPVNGKVEDVITLDLKHQPK